MPKPTKSRRSRRAAATEVAEEADPIVGGEPIDGATAEATEPSLGQSIDWVRQALEPHDADTRKRIIRAANQLMK